MHVKNRVMTIAAAAVVAAAPLSANLPAASAAEFAVENAQVLTLFGDVNFDGTIGVSDGVQLSRYILGQTDALGNVKNADLLADGKIDVFDMVYLRKLLTGDALPKGTKMTVRVVDMMTGEPLENADVTLSEMNGNVLYNIGSSTPTLGEDITYYGLPDDTDCSYFIFVENLPDGYDTAYKTWDQVVMLDIAAGTAEKEVVIRVTADDEKPNVKFTHMDWSQGRERVGYGNLTITDKDGNYYYQRQYTGEVALPDGDYHAEFNPFEYPIALVDPDSAFAAMVKENYPDAEFEDLSDGIDFSVVNGKPDRDLFINLGPIEGQSNTIKVNCYDSVTGEPLEGVKLSLIEAPYSYKKTQSWVSDGTEKVFDDLVRSGPDAYKVVVDSVPEGYANNEDEQWASWGYVYGYTSTLDFYFTPEAGDKELSFSVLTWPDMKPYTGSATFAVMKGDSKIVTGLKAGEKFALPDGDYFICPFKYEDDDTYRGIHFGSELGSLFSEEHDTFKYEFTTDMMHFSVIDGKLNKDIVLYVGDKDKALTVYEEEFIPEEKKEAPIE